MKAMLLTQLGTIDKESEPLCLKETAIPQPGPGEILIRIKCCGVCHTELDEIEGRTPPPKLPVIPGHQVVGIVEALGEGCSRWQRGDKVGVAWIFSACGKCGYCRNGLENLCPHFRATGRDANGGYAQYMTVNEKFAVPIPAQLSASEAAPLLCAGAIGYRSLKLTGIKDGEILGLTGFGASAHLVLKLVRHSLPATPVFVFARSGRQREFALELGAQWAGNIGEKPPEAIKAVIDTTPVWRPVVEALEVLAPGGRLVINAIRKESFDKKELLNLEYEKHLWLEKEIKSVANVTRKDVENFLALAKQLNLQPEITAYSLPEANKALVELKFGKSIGAKVLLI